jgi:hypothetical protein
MGWETSRGAAPEQKGSAPCAFNVGNLNVAYQFKGSFLRSAGMNGIQLRRRPQRVDRMDGMNRRG